MSLGFDNNVSSNNGQHTTPYLMSVSLVSSSLRARVIAGRMMGSCSYPGQKQLLKSKICQLCPAPLMVQWDWVVQKTRQDHPSQDCIAPNSHKDRELDTEGREVIPRITANAIPMQWCSVNLSKKIEARPPQVDCVSGIQISKAKCASTGSFSEQTSSARDSNEKCTSQV